MNINYYQVLYSILFSPLGWAGIVLGVAALVFSYWQLVRSQWAIYVDYTWVFTGEPPVGSGVLETHTNCIWRIHRLRYADGRRQWIWAVPKVWFGLMLVIGLAMVFMLGLPMACVFTPLGQTFICG